MEGYRKELSEGSWRNLGDFAPSCKGMQRSDGHDPIAPTIINNATGLAHELFEAISTSSRPKIYSDFLKALDKSSDIGSCVKETEDGVSIKANSLEPECVNKAREVIYATLACIGANVRNNEVSHNPATNTVFITAEAAARIIQKQKSNSQDGPGGRGA